MKANYDRTEVYCLKFDAYGDPEDYASVILVSCPQFNKEKFIGMMFDGFVVIAIECDKTSKITGNYGWYTRAWTELYRNKNVPGSHNKLDKINHIYNVTCSECNTNYLQSMIEPYQCESCNSSKIKIKREESQE